MLLKYYSIATLLQILLGGGGAFLSHIEASEPSDPMCEVPVAELDELHVRSPLLISQSTIRLAPVLRQLAALGSAETHQVEILLNNAYDEYRTVLASEMAEIKRNGETTKYISSAVGVAMSEVFTKLMQEKTALTKSGTLNQAQLSALEVFLFRKGVKGLDDMLPGIDFWREGREETQAGLSIQMFWDPTSTYNYIIRSVGQRSISTIDIGVGRDFAYAMGCRIAEPWRLPGAPFPMAKPVVIRAGDPGIISLAELDKLLNLLSVDDRNLLDVYHYDKQLRSYISPWDAFCADGHLRPSPRLRQICGLDDRQAEAISSAWSLLYSDFRRIIAMPPPHVATIGGNAFVLTFQGVSDRAKALRPRLEQALHPLVSRGILQPEQAEFLNGRIMREFAELTFNYGIGLEEIVLRYRVTDPGQVHVRMKRGGGNDLTHGSIAWMYEQNTGSYCGQSSKRLAKAIAELMGNKAMGAAQSSGGWSVDGKGNSQLREKAHVLPSRLRICLDFIPITAPETLPPLALP